MIFVYRNVDSDRGDFGLVRQEGDEQFVVLTKAEYAGLVDLLRQAVQIIEITTRQIYVAPGEVPFTERARAALGMALKVEGE